MSNLTEAEFSRHLNTSFMLLVSDEEKLDLELTEVNGYAGSAEEQQGLERFSAYFRGPKQPYLRQRMYRLNHAVMGEFDLFLVPVGFAGQGILYEAVFNYFRT